MKLSKIQTGVFRTLSYFDLYDRPLTFDELYLYLYQARASETELEKEVGELINQSQVGKLGEWYFLPGRLKFLEEYPARLEHAENLIRKNQKKLWVLRNVPFLQMLAVVNSVALKTVHSKSDIDIFVIAKKNRLYTTRFFLIRFLKFMKIQPKTEQNMAGKVCASFLIDQTAVNLDNIKLKNIQDVCFDFWLISFMPLVGEKEFQSFISRNQNIMKNFPNFNYKLKYQVSGWNYPDVNQRSIFVVLVEWFFGGYLGDTIEKIIRNYYIPRIKKLSGLDWKTKPIKIEKHILKLHKNDCREAIAQRYQEKIKEIIKE